MQIDSNPLAQPFTIKNIKIKNRIAKSATQENMTDDKGIIKQSYYDFYEKLSEGGVGLIITGHMYINKDRHILGMASADSDEQIPHLQKVTSAVHKNGSVIFAQLNYARPNFLPGKKSLVNSLSINEITDIVEDFGRSATLVKKAGFDGIQIHGAHGYVISQFLSKINRRRDEYGGSLKNRQRFCLEVYRKIREKVGEEFPVIIKLDSYLRSFETIPPLRIAIKLKEALDTAKKFEEAGIDAIEVSFFQASRGAIPLKESITCQLKERGNVKKAAAVGILLTPIDLILNRNFWFKPNYNIEHIKIFKKNLKIPVLAGSCFRDPDYMKRVIENGESDMICMARPLICEPDFPSRILNGSKDVSACINCNLCGIFLIPNGKQLKCCFGKTSA